MSKCIGVDILRKVISGQRINFAGRGFVALDKLDEIIDSLAFENDTPAARDGKVEFVSYTGKYPNLCSGVLTISVNGKEYELRYVMCPSGKCDYRSETVERGSWRLHDEAIPDELKPFKEEIIRLVNENVEYGCCGGCL